MNTSMFPFILLMVCIPFGTAVQSIAIGIAALSILISQRKNLRSLPDRLGLFEKRSIGLILMVTLFQMGATLLNPANPTHDIVSFFVGYAPLIFLPCLFVLMPPFTLKQLNRLEVLWASMFFIWMIVIISQNIWGWKIAGTSIVTGPSYHRSQGFYSHPLTLAYVALMLWPINLVLFAIDIKKISRLIVVIGNLALLYYSASRTAQAVALLISLGFLLYYFRGKNRLFILGGLLLSLAGIFSTENSVSRRFKSMPTQISEEKESPYADDRIAFWLVHYMMVKERPVMGHGINLDKAYRQPYYEAVGLHNFKKAYEAHNQILQIAAEGGMGAAFAFMFWMMSLHFNWWYSPRLLGHIRDLTVLSLFLGGLTQNAYLDGEVRFALMLLMALAFALGFHGLMPTVKPDLPSEQSA